jgi:hypothetical protein
MSVLIYRAVLPAVLTKPILVNFSVRRFTPRIAVKTTADTASVFLYAVQELRLDESRLSRHQP